MTRILVAADSDSIHNQVASVLKSDVELIKVPEGRKVRDTVLRHGVDLAIIDFQIGNMGGVAACLDLRLEHSGGRAPFVPVLLLCDRRADVFMARRAGAQGWLVKPLEPLRIRKAINSVLAGEDYHDQSYLPSPVAVAPYAG